MVRAPGGLAVLALPFLALPAPTPRLQDGAFLDLRSVRVGDALPPEWQARRVGDATAAVSRVEEGPTGARWLTLSAEGDASQLWIELDPVRDPAAGELRWVWRVDRAVPGARLADPPRDDSPARLFVVFGEGGLFSAPTTLFYSWGGDAPTARAFRSHVSDRIGVIVVRSSGFDPVGEWLEERRDVQADYRAVFGEAPDEPVTALGFMIDTDQTGVLAESGLRSLEWRTRPEVTPHA